MKRYEKIVLLDFCACFLCLFVTEYIKMTPIAFYQFERTGQFTNEGNVLPGWLLSLVVIAGPAIMSMHDTTGVCVSKLFFNRALSMDCVDDCGGG